MEQSSPMPNKTELQLETGYGTIAPQRRWRRSRGSLAIASESWMSALSDETPVSALTIPGTHDSAAFTLAWPFIVTQTLDILGQLDAGIRYFDLRCGIRDDLVEMVHGSAVLGLRLDVVLDTMYTWLENHLTEALVVQIKRDRNEENATMHFSQAIVQTIDAKPERWRTANTTPSLGELRGKIQLFRRFEGHSLYAYGLDVTRWQDNPSSPFTIFTWHGVQITIQDHYSFSEPETLPSLISKKGGDVSQLLDRAALDPCPDHWYINFTSGFEFNLYYQITPKTVALGGWWAFRHEEGMNMRLRGYLQSHPGKRRFGIVAMDFPEAKTPGLIMAVVRSNFKHKHSPKSWDWILYAVVLLLVLAILLASLLLHRIEMKHWCPPLLHACAIPGPLREKSLV